MLKVRILAPLLISGTTWTDDSHVMGEYRIESVNIRRSIKEIDSFSFEILAGDLTSEFDFANPLIPIYAQVFRDDIQYTDGYLVNVRYKKDRIVLDCVGILYLLSWYSFEDRTTTGVNFAWNLYNNVQAAVIFYELTDSSLTPLYVRNRGIFGQLEVGNFFHWANPHIAINFDMRELEVVSDALFKLSDAVDGTYYQWGGFRSMRTTDAAFARVNIGNFARNLNFEYNENNILDIEIEKTHEPVLTFVSPYGGTYENPAGTVQIIHLNSGTIPATALDPLYGFGVGTNRVALNTPPTSVYTKSKEMYVDAEVQTKISPGAPQRARASTTLYREAVRYLKEAYSQDSTQTLQISTNEMPENLMPGNIVKVNYEFKYPIFIPGLNKTVNRYMGNTQINDEFYIQEYDLTLYENDLDLNLILKSEQTFQDSDYTKVTKKTLKQIKKNKEFFVDEAVPAKHVVGLYDITVGTGLASNTTLLGNPARTTTVSKLGAANFGNASTIPLAGNPVVTYKICTDPEYEDRVNLEFGTVPSGGSANFTVITQFDDNWTVNDQVRVKILVFFNVP